jgi:hypothetical protein
MEQPAPTSGAAASSHPSAGISPSKPAAPAKTTSRDRGANVRRNLRRWWKILAAVTGGWFVLTLVVCIGAISYAHANNFGQRRIEMLGQGFGTASAILLAVIWLTILVIADRKKAP